MEGDEKYYIGEEYARKSLWLEIQETIDSIQNSRDISSSFKITLVYLEGQEEAVTMTILYDYIGSFSSVYVFPGKILFPY